MKTPLDNGSGSDDSSDDEREVGGVGGGANSSDEEIGDMIIILNKVSPVQLRQKAPRRVECQFYSIFHFCDIEDKRVF